MYIVDIIYDQFTIPIFFVRSLWYDNNNNNNNVCNLVKINIIIRVNDSDSLNWLVLFWLIETGASWRVLISWNKLVANGIYYYFHHYHLHYHYFFIFIFIQIYYLVCIKNIKELFFIRIWSNNFTSAKW